MRKKKIESDLRGIAESAVYESFINVLVRDLAKLGVTVKPVYPNDHFPSADFSSRNRLVAEACKIAFQIGELQATRGMALHGMIDIDEEQSRLNEIGERCGIAGGDASREQAGFRRVEILNAYAKWAANPKNSKLPMTAFAKQLAASKKSKDKKVRGFGKSTIAAVVSRFEEDVQAIWPTLRLPDKSRSTLAVAARIAERMNEQPGVSPETIRRALQK